MCPYRLTIPDRVDTFIVSAPEGISVLEPDWLICTGTLRKAARHDGTLSPFLIISAHDDTFSSFAIKTLETSRLCVNLVGRTFVNSHPHQIPLHTTVNSTFHTSQAHRNISPKNKHFFGFHNPNLVGGYNMRSTNKRATRSHAMPCHAGPNRKPKSGEDITFHAYFPAKF